ncbi:hypothetical protein AN1V17_11670 [Vallitalea sediminicola]
MDMKKLEQFRNLVREIEILEKRISGLEQELQECVADTVRASSKSFPYIQHTVRISGVDARKIDKISRVKDILSKRKAKLYHDMEEVEKFISTIEDSIIRQIITLRFIKGWSWNNVAMTIYGYPNGDTARKKITRYFNEI